MRIAHLWQDYSPNLFDKAHPLCMAHGHDSEVVCLAFIDNGAAALPATFAVRHRNPAESNSRSLTDRLIRRLRRPADERRFARLVAQRVAAFRPDLLHLHFGTTAALLQRLGALPDLPLVVSFYGVDVSQSLQDPAVVRAYRTVGARATVLHVLCDAARQRLLDIGCPATSIRIANLPANVEAMPDLGVDITGTTRFLIPARFVEKKGHRLLLQAFKRLHDDGLPATLTCFGYGPSDWLAQAIAEAGLSDAVRVVNNGQSGNFAAEYEAMLRDHDVVLAPSIRSRNGDDEGGPALTLVMAQAAGKPVIVSDFPGAERSVTDGCEGVVVPAGDATALHRAMSALAAQPQCWHALGQAGRQRVMREFSDQAYWNVLSDWYAQAAVHE